MNQAEHIWAPYLVVRRQACSLLYLSLTWRLSHFTSLIAVITFLTLICILRVQESDQLAARVRKYAVKSLISSRSGLVCHSSPCKFTWGPPGDRQLLHSNCGDLRRGYILTADHNSWNILSHSFGLLTLWTGCKKHFDDAIYMNMYGKYTYILCF